MTTKNSKTKFVGDTEDQLLFLKEKTEHLEKQLNLFTSFVFQTQKTNNKLVEELSVVKTANETLIDMLQKKEKKNLELTENLHETKQHLNDINNKLLEACKRLSYITRNYSDVTECFNCKKCIYCGTSKCLEI